MEKISRHSRSRRTFAFTYIVVCFSPRALGGLLSHRLRHGDDLLLLSRTGEVRYMRSYIDAATIDFLLMYVLKGSL